MSNRREVASGFVHRVNDPGFRLNGENPASASLEDAKGWATIYDRLIAFKRELLELCNRFAEKSEPEVARAIEDADMILLETQISRFQQKRDYWKIRATELAGSGRRGGSN